MQRKLGEADADGNWQFGSPASASAMGAGAGAGAGADAASCLTLRRRTRTRTRRTVLGQYFIFFSFASTGTYMFATISSSLTLLYLEQFNDQQLHALLCERAAELFVEPLLAFISATLYLLVSGVLFCVYVYGAEAGIGLSVVVTVPILKICKAWSYLERFDKRSFNLAKRLQQGKQGRRRRRRCRRHRRLRRRRRRRRRLTL